MPRPDFGGRYDFDAWLVSRCLDLPPTGIDTLWLNITRLCNQACHHCHMEASQDKPLHMSDEVIYRCLMVLKKHDSIKTVDITGGAPELHPRFRQFVETCRMMDKHVVVRHNLTVTLDGDPLTGEAKRSLPHFFAANRVEVLASLPCCDEEATDAVRGRGVFRKSIESLRLLNSAGYGSNPNLRLKLVANSNGPLSESGRMDLEREFKDTLGGYGASFDDLLTVTNMPIGRYADTLRREDRFTEYMDSMIETASEQAAQAAVCRSLISVSPDGGLYDCDFNQALGHSIGSIFEFSYDTLANRRISFGSHCFGCVAGAGSG
jgi:radical SAM/Cys-rich protein